MVREPTDAERALHEQAEEARSRAYAPYSDFTVGAALLAADGRVVTGGNVENASYGLTICAERAAVCRALAEGLRELVAVAVAAPERAVTASPCGACRQVLSEFGPELTVVYRLRGELVAQPLSELLPAAFELAENHPGA
jgi:homotetrameric cytidine deaminase